MGSTVMFVTSSEFDTDLAETVIVDSLLRSEDGWYSVVSSFDSVDENGYYFDLRGIFTILSEEYASSVLEDLSSQQMGILSEVYPYKWGGFDSSNTEVSLFSSVYNGLSDPVITKEASSWESFGYRYDVHLDSNEIAGLQSKFGFTSVSIEDQLDSALRTITSEVYNSYIAKRISLKRGPRPKLMPSNFASLRRIDITVTGSATAGSSGGY